MKLLNTGQVNHLDLLSIRYDALIVSSGYESRAVYLSKYLKKGSQTEEINIPFKYCLSFNEHKNEKARPFNDLFFNREGFKQFECSGNDKTILQSILNDILSLKRKELKILIDYSCMTRVWYAYILKFFSVLKATDTISVELYFAYTQSEFISPPDTKIYNEQVEPIQGFYSISVPTKPTALVVGLGYLQEQGFGLSEFFDSEIFLFINKDSDNDLFYDKVLEQNSLLIAETAPSNIFYYSISNMNYSEALLHTLCKDLGTLYRIVLVPCGPKPFSLLCLLTSMKLNTVDVWRISPGVNEIPVDKQSNGNIFPYKVTFGES